jgi:hypothetical protein
MVEGVRRAVLAMLERQQFGPSEEHLATLVKEGVRLAFSANLLRRDQEAMGAAPRDAAARLYVELFDYESASAESRSLESPALELAGAVHWSEAVEVFRRVAAREITAGSFLTNFGEAVAAADLPNQVLMLPTIFKLLAKYPQLLDQHREKPSITAFPPEG